MSTIPSDLELVFNTETNEYEVAVNFIIPEITDNEKVKISATQKYPVAIPEATKKKLATELFPYISSMLKVK